jgi:CMP-N-acetylneuraminic acid synthetase
VIPARGGSKRVPGKNVRPLFGVPLLSYTIDAALSSGVFEQVIVSTDSPEIAHLARESGADVPFLRDPELADDFTPASRVTLDALMRTDPAGTRFRYVAQLMPSCPLRTALDVLDSFHQFEGTHDGTQISVSRFSWQNPWWAMLSDADHRLHPLFADRFAARSQDLPEVFCPSGAIWWATSDCLRREGTYHTRDRTGWVIPWPRGLDIDTDEDWRLAEALMAAPRPPVCDESRG